MGLSLAVLLAQRHQVTVVDIVPEKVEKNLSLEKQGIKILFLVPNF